MSDKEASFGDKALGVIFVALIVMGLGAGWNASAYDGLYAEDIEAAQKSCAPFGGLKLLRDPQLSDEAIAYCNDGKRITFAARTEEE